MAPPRVPNLEGSIDHGPPAEIFNDDLVRIIVGPKKERFGFPKRLLCRYSDYFRAALNSVSQEGPTREVHLDKDDPEIFELFHTWVYFQCISDELLDDKDHDWYRLSHLYVFADMRLVPKLKNYIIDRILTKYNDLQRVSLHHIAYIYDNTPTSSPLRKLIADLFSCTPNLDKVNEQDTEFLLVSTSKEFLWDLIHSLFESRSPMRTLSADLLTCNERTEKLDEDTTQAFLDFTPSGFLWDLAQALYESRAQHLPPLEMGYFRREVCRYHEHRNGERCVTGEPAQADVAGIGRGVERMTL